MDDSNRRAILRRRMAFVGGALAAVSGCDKNAPPPPPDGVVIVDFPHTGGPSAATSSTATPPAAPATKMPPPPSIAIPDTTCKGDREELERVQRLFDAIYAELTEVYDALPGSCAVTDDTCLPEHRPLAGRIAKLQQDVHAFGKCPCPAPIVAEYWKKHHAEARQRLALIRDHVVRVAGSQAEAGAKWDELVRNEAGPRPCLKCVACEVKSACDP